MEEESIKKIKDGMAEWVDEIKTSQLVPFGWEVIRGEQLLKMKIPERDFIIEKIMPSAGIIILSGNPGCGKSWLALEIARAISSDQPLFGKFNVKGTGVLYIDEESSLYEIKRRWQALGADFLAFTDFVSLKGFKIDDAEQRKDLLDLTEWRKHGLIIFDSLRDIHNKNENDSKETQELIDYFREITKRGITVLILHHNRKDNPLTSKDPSQLLRGSTAILAGLDCLISVTSKKIDDKNMEFIISQPKLRQGKPVVPFKVNLIENEDKMIFEYVGDVEEKTDRLEETKEAVLQFLREGEKFRKEIIEFLILNHFSERSIQRAITELNTEEKIQPRKDGRKMYFSILESVPSE